MTNDFFNIDIEGYVPLEIKLVEPDDFLKIRGRSRASSKMHEKKFM